MKTSLTTLASAFLFALTMSVSSFGRTPSDQPEKKSFAVVMYPAAAASKVWLCLEKYKPDHKIKVALLDEKGHVLFTEFLPEKGGKQNGYRQQFDMSQIEDGKYTFRISDGSQTEEVAFKVSTPGIEQQLSSTRLISLN